MRFHSERRFSPSSRVTSPGSVVSMSQIRPRRGPQPKDPGKPGVIHQIAVAQMPSQDLSVTTTSVIQGQGQTPVSSLVRGNIGARCRRETRYNNETPESY